MIGSKKVPERGIKINNTVSLGDGLELKSIKQIFSTNLNKRNKNI